MSEALDGWGRSGRWLYEGSWGLLTQWLRVPRMPPTLPVRAGEQLDRRRPADGFLRYLSLQFWISTIVLGLIATSGWLVLTFVQPMIGLLVLPLLLLLLVVPATLGYLAMYLRFDTTWYVLTDHSLRIRRGIWIIHETTITFENIQNVSVRQGPLQRFFGISDLVVETAGGGGGGGPHGGVQAGAHMGLIEGVSDASSIRDAMLARIRQNRTTGLGDEHPHPANESDRPGWSPQHLERLRQIRDLLQTAVAS